MSSSRKILRAGLLTAVILSPWTVLANTCEAGPILDWLLGRRRRVNYGMSSCAPGTQVARRVVVNYAPQTCYRNRWMRVPVTRYRPTATVDPVSGCQVTCMRPCTTYKWQVQRVAVTVMRPVYSTVLANPCGVAANCNGCAPTAAATTSSNDDYYNRPRAQTRPSLPVQEKNNGAKAKTGVSTQRSLLRRRSIPFPRRQLKPIPDAQTNPTLDITPKLLRGRDRTAIYYPIRRAWAYTPIKWNEVSKKGRAKPKLIRAIGAATQIQSNRTVRRLDDSGWSSD